MDRSDVDSLEAFLKSEGGQKSMDDFIKNMEDEDERLRQFFETDRFNRIIKNIKKHLNESDERSINDQHLLYDKKLEKKICNYIEYCDIFGAIEENLKFIHDDEAYFSTDWLEYQDLIFQISFGQGTALIVSLPPYVSITKKYLDEKNIQNN